MINRIFPRMVNRMEWSNIQQVPRYIAEWWQVRWHLPGAKSGERGRQKPVLPDLQAGRGPIAAATRERIRPPGRSRSIREKQDGVSSERPAGAVAERRHAEALHPEEMQSVGRNGTRNGRIRRPTYQKSRRE